MYNKSSKYRQKLEWDEINMGVESQSDLERAKQLYLNFVWEFRLDFFDSALTILFYLCSKSPVPYYFKLNRSGSVLLITSNKLSWMIKFIWAALPIKESILFPLTLKFMSSRCNVVSLFFPFYSPRIFWTISLSIFESSFFEEWGETRAECQDT